MVDNDATKCPHCKTPLETDEEEEYQKWKKCPRCRQQRAKRVLWTFWGSFYFTALFKHVKCQECGKIVTAPKDMAVPACCDRPMKRIG